MSENKLLTAKQVGELLEFHPKTIKNWALEGRIPSYRFPGGVRFRPDDIQDWIQRHYEPAQ